MASSYPRIGIFWVYQDKLISKSILLPQASYSSVGIADCSFSHIDVWELEKVYLPEYPLLFDSEYQTLPRGRILFDKKNNITTMVVTIAISNRESDSVCCGGASHFYLPELLVVRFWC